MATLSFGSYISSKIYLAIALRWLSGSRFLDLEDCYGVEENSVHGIIKQTLEVLDDVLVMDKFDPWDLLDCKWLAEKMFNRSQHTITMCIGVLDGIVRANMETPGG
jgi:hypothetical protein